MTLQTGQFKRTFIFITEVSNVENYKYLIFLNKNFYKFVKKVFDLNVRFNGPVFDVFFNVNSICYNKTIIL